MLIDETIETPHFLFTNLEIDDNIIYILYNNIIIIFDYNKNKKIK